VNIKGVSICGRPATQLRELFRAYDKSPTPSHFKDGEFVRVPKLLTVEFVADRMKISAQEARMLMECLRGEGFLATDSDLPTQMSAALKSASAMSKIRRTTADRILNDVLLAARKIGRLSRTKTKIAKIEVFGSYLTDAPLVGDIDLRVSFTHTGGVSERSVARMDAIAKKLRVSRYVSLHQEFDTVAAATVRKRIFP
jgi:hypothetical protein